MHSIKYISRLTSHLIAALKQIVFTLQRKDLITQNTRMECYNDKLYI